MIVVYRACSVGNPNKIRPIQDKLDLVRTCFRSFIKAFEGVEYKLVILLDKPNMEFREIFKGCEVEETFYTDFNEGNIKSFHRQIDLVLEHQDKFLFIEDDYYFLPNTGAVIEQALNELAFLTPYDHPDYYTNPIHDYQRRVRLAGGHHWQTVSATTLTFGGQYQPLQKEAGVIKKYGWADCPMWQDITQRYPLFAPIPTLATHMESVYLAPNVVYPFLQTSL